MMAQTGTDVRRYWIHCLAFAGFAMIFYGLFPQFLMQNHDAQNVYFTLTKSLEWRNSIFEIYAYSPLAGMGTTFWPLTLPAIPYLTVFALTDDPTLRIYLLQVAAAITLFAGSLFFFCTISTNRTTAIGASWMAFMVIMLYGQAHVSAPENLQVTVWLFVALGALARVGKGNLALDLSWLLLFEVAVAGFVLSVPAWHIVALPVFCICALALLLVCESGTQRAWRAGALAMAVALQAMLGTYQALRYTLSDTARVQLRELFLVNPHFQTISGHLLNNQFIDLMVGALFVIGIAYSRPRDFDLLPGYAFYVATLAIYAFLLPTGLYFYYTSGPWPLPWPKYLVMFAYPLTALFAARGIALLMEKRPDRARVVAVFCAISIYFVWHVINTVQASPAIGIVFAVIVAFKILIVIAVMVAFFAVARFGAPRIAILFMACVLVFGCLRFVDGSFGGGADKRFDGALRMGLARTPVIDYLAERVGLEPGKPFRGLVEDIYSRPSGGRELIDTITEHWAGNWMKYGNGHKLFAWNVHGIPITAEYNQYTKPPYFLLYTRLLNEPTDQQVFNYLTATRINVRILKMLGVRFLVTDEDVVMPKEGRTVFQWDKFRVHELDDPNIANYSPTHTLAAKTAEGAIAIIANPAFNPRESVVIESADIPVGTQLTPAIFSDMVYMKGGIRFRGKANGRSLVVLPVQFTHCLMMQPVAGAKLVRVNLAMTGILFEGSIDAELQYNRWPLGTTMCQQQDFEDTQRLLRQSPHEEISDIGAHRPL